MYGNEQVFDGDDSDNGSGTADSPQPSASTPLLEVARGDGYRWASLDVADLDPPALLPPSVTEVIGRGEL